MFGLFGEVLHLYGDCGLVFRLGARGRDLVDYLLQSVLVDDAQGAEDTADPVRFESDCYFGVAKVWNEEVFGAVLWDFEVLGVGLKINFGRI
jgi:hypothetical protein